MTDLDATQKKHLAKLRQLLSAEDSVSVQQGVDLLRSLADPQLVAVLAEGTRIDETVYLGRRGRVLHGPEVERRVRASHRDFVALAVLADQPEAAAVTVLDVDLTGGFDFSAFARLTALVARVDGGVTIRGLAALVRAHDVVLEDLSALAHAVVKGRAISIADVAALAGAELEGTDVSVLRAPRALHPRRRALGGPPDARDAGAPGFTGGLRSSAGSAEAASCPARALRRESHRARESSAERAPRGQCDGRGDPRPAGGHRRDHGRRVQFRNPRGHRKSIRFRTRGAPARRCGGACRQRHAGAPNAGAHTPGGRPLLARGAARPHRAHTDVTGRTQRGGRHRGRSVPSSGDVDAHTARRRRRSAVGDVVADAGGPSVAVRHPGIVGGGLRVRPRHALSAADGENRGRGVQCPTLRGPRAALLRADAPTPRPLASSSQARAR